MTEVAPRIQRIGEEIVNAYLVEDGGEVTIVDGGAPTYWEQVPAKLAAIGRTLDDVRAIVLTHGHDDHLGFVERARSRGLPVRIHAADEGLATGRDSNQTKFVGPYRLRPSVQFLWFYARRGLLRVPRIREVATFDDGATLDVPGAPRVVHVPGHTLGSSALHFAGHDTVFTGDAINTYAVTSGASGPMLSPFNRDRAQALDSLRRLEALEATHVLTGHGASWHLGLRAAVEAARASEVARNLR